jgi:hypothetical protein
MFRVASQPFLIRASLVLAGLLTTGAFAQVDSAQSNPNNQNAKTADEKPAKDAAGATQAQPVDEAQDPLKRPIDAKKKKQQMKDYSKEIKGPYKKWLDEDVVYIITPEERTAFKQLSNDEERDNFIEAFWQRRDPTPDTEENEYKEEHYQRIAGASTSCLANRMKLIPTPPAELMSGRWKRAAEKRRPSHLKTGAIVTSKGSDRKSLLNSSTPACAASTT